MRASGSGQSAYLLLDVLDRIAPLSIPYAVIGGHAVSFHGIPRFTKDADVTLWLTGTGKNARDMQAHLATGDLSVELNSGDMDDPIGAVLIVRDQYENQVDLVLGVRGMDAGAAGRCLRTTLLSVPVQMIGVEDLIAMKLFAGGIQDLEDVRGILEVSRDRADVPLMQRLAEQYGKDVREKLDRLLGGEQP